jgi:hypothetical protein
VQADSTHGPSVTPSDVSDLSAHGLSVTDGEQRSHVDAYIEDQWDKYRHALALLGISVAQSMAMAEARRADRHWGTLVCGDCHQSLDETEPVVFAYQEGYGSSAVALHLRCSDAAMPSMARTNRWVAEPLFNSKRHCVHCNREMIFGQRLSGLVKIKNSCTPYCGQQHRLRQTRLTPREKICVSCQRSFLPRRNDAATCSNRCRQRMHRQRITN